MGIDILVKPHLQKDSTVRLGMIKHQLFALYDRRGTSSKMYGLME